MAILLVYGGSGGIDKEKVGGRLAGPCTILVAEQPALD